MTERFRFSLEGRERTALIVISLALLYLLAGIVRLQVFEHAELSAQSEKNFLRVVPIEPRRGLMYDRSMQVIVDNRPSYTVAVVPAEEIPEVTLPNLSEVIGLDTTEIRRRIKRNLVSRYQPVPVKRDIPFRVVAMLEEQSSRFPGVSYSMERVRMYPRGLGTEAFTGYVGEVSPDELKNLSPELYRLGSTIGKKGLEKQYDQLLRGREGTKYVEVFASGQILGDYAGRPVDPGTPGSDLVLTIDMDLQAACAQALDTFCCGAIVAMDPRSGEVLALASYPGFDANIFSSVIPDSLWREIRGDSTHPLLNRPLNGLYPPGSTVKFVTVGAGMMEGLINENSRLNPCLGGMQFGNRFFRCWQAGGHGSLNGAHALEQSCDVFMYQLGLKLGIDKLSEYFDGCGFGKLTGIDLPGEAAGLNPNSAYYNERYGRNKWTRALVLNNSIGQGELLVTPIQLAQFFCGLANRGIVFRPHLLKSRRLPDGRIVETAPEVSFNLPFSERTLAYLKEGMRLVVEGKQGTARALRDPRYHFGGKTGTAQNPHGENHSWFVGVAPLDAPEIVVAAIVENAGEGSAVAAPLVKKILDAYMAKTDSTFALQAPNPETAE